MNGLFADPEQDRVFHEEGYLITPFLNPNEVAELKAFFDDEVPEIPSDFFTTTMSSDSDRRWRVLEKVRAVFAPKLEAIVPGYKVSFAMFIVKRPVGKEGKVGIHLDYTIAREGKDIGVNLWCPLMDTGVNNSGLKVIPKTHNFCEHFGVMPNPNSPFEPFYPRLESDYSVQLSVEAGNLVMLDARLLHWSEPNRSDALRVSIGGFMIPQESPPHLYIRNPETPGVLDVLEVTEKFLCRMTQERPILEPYPEGVRKVEALRNPMVPLREEDMERYAELFL